MPKSTTMGLRCVLALVAALAVAAACCASAGAVVGRRSRPRRPTLPPVRSTIRSRSSATTARPTSSGQFCGGSVRDDAGRPRHIVTAAHCVFDNSATAPGQPIAPANLDVLVGTPSSPTSARPPTARRRRSRSIRRYDPATLSHDAAVLTLAGTAPLNGTGPADRLRRTPSRGRHRAGSTQAVVSGWGRRSTSGDLSRRPALGARCRSATDATLPGELGRGGRSTTSIMVCAGQPGNGLVLRGQRRAARHPGRRRPRRPRDAELAGIVSYGRPRVRRHPPGVYTRVASPAIQSYLSQANPVSAPRNTSPPRRGRHGRGRSDDHLRPGQLGRRARRSTTSSCAASTAARRRR